MVDINFYYQSTVALVRIVSDICETLGLKFKTFTLPLLIIVLQRSKIIIGEDSRGLVESFHPSMLLGSNPETRDGIVRFYQRTWKYPEMCSFLDGLELVVIG